MAISEVYNCDCVEYMKKIPDNHFDIAICDTPYGDAENGNFVMGGRFGGWFDRYKQPIAVPRRRQVESLLQATNYPPLISKSRLESTRKEKRGLQSTSDRKTSLRKRIQPIFIAVVAERKNTTRKTRASCNALTGTLHQRKNFGTSFSASARIKLFGAATTFGYRPQDVS